MSIESDRKRRRLIGIGFVLAFALSTATLIYTGLNVRAPGSASRPSVTAADEPESAGATAEAESAESAAEVEGQSGARAGE